MIKKIYDLRYRITWITLLIVLIVLISLFLVSIFTPSTPEITEQQQSCDHEWYEVGYDSDDWGHLLQKLYCPKCKLEQDVGYEAWKKLKADMEYEKENSND